MTVTLGKKVADFESLSTELNEAGLPGRFKLSQRKQAKLVIYFYPKDNTPGCTTQGSDFRDQYSSFVKAGCDVVGVSRDSLKAHASFRSKFDFPFHLLSDPEEALCAQFDVMKMKNMYGKQVRGIERSTFVIDSVGKLAREWRGVKVAGHVAEVLAFVQTLP
jgi:thioredoxin-dependent peroxiredoxin